MAFFMASPDPVARAQSAPTPTPEQNLTPEHNSFFSTRSVGFQGQARFQSLRMNISQRINQRASTPRRGVVPRAASLLVRTRSLFGTMGGDSLFPFFFRPNTYTCQICLDTLTADQDEDYDPYVLENCAHIFCKGCLNSYLRSKILEGVVTITCFYCKNDDDASTSPPSSSMCSTAFSDRDIKSILLSQDGGEEVFEKYKKFKFDKENENSRRCPQCDTAQINRSGTAADGKIIQPIMTCVSCNEKYCFYHSNSHPGISCEEYEKKEEEANRLNSEFIKQFAKPCPQCKMLVSKSGGCNQMKCTKCGCHFCWLCNKKVDAGTFPTHYQWWNLNGCPNMQMNDSIAPSRGEVARSKGLAILQVIVLSVPSFALSILSSILCCFCMGLMGDTKLEKLENCMSFWGNALTVIIAIPVCLAFGASLIVIFPVWCMLYTIFATCMAIFHPSSLEERRSSFGSRGSWGSLIGVGQTNGSGGVGGGEFESVQASDVSVEVMEEGFSPGLGS